MPRGVRHYATLARQRLESDIQVSNNGSTWPVKRISAKVVPETPK
jgi:hypothetical protein